MRVPILRQGRILIVTVHAGLDDEEWKLLLSDVARRAGAEGARGVLVDVTALDVVDSFAARTLRTITMVTRLRGAETVIAGIQPEVAFAMTELGLASRLTGIRTALDFEDGMAMLTGQIASKEHPQ